MLRVLITLMSTALFISAAAQYSTIHLRKKDYKKDILLQTSMGDMVVRLYDATPLHRDNFIWLVKKGKFDSLLFHRVINHFMIQAGDPKSKYAKPGQFLGEGDLGYTVPAEFRPGIFHKKGVIAAARTGDDVNPKKESSASQFYIVQGKVFTDVGLDSVETYRLHAKIPPAEREVYKTIGGTPHLDQNYTIFGEVISGTEVIDKIAEVPTNKEIGDRPVTDVVIIKAKLVKRKRQTAEGKRQTANALGE